MTEIKFRAWDNLKKRMVEVCGVDFSEGLPSVLHTKAKGEVTKSDTMMGLRFSLMQYTGLKDKNGKEVYFGDFLQTSNDDPEFDLWEPDDWGYAICKERSDRLGICFANWWPTDDDDSVFNWQFVEIIGNIYENPELLNENPQQ